MGPPRNGSYSDPSSPTSSSSSAASPAVSPGGNRHFALRINLASCKYPVLRVVQRQLGWVEVDDEDAHVHWCDTSAGTERLVRLSRPQRLNHFPGMLEIARKKGLARNLANMRALFPGEYDFSPRSFLLPEMMDVFETELLEGGGSGSGPGRRPTFIMKLDNGSMGRGIKLVQTYSQFAEALPTFDHENVVASQYIDRPLLIGGKKFDLRIYVLVRCCDPLRIFLCREGLVRFCTEPYKPPAASNLDNAYAHLTNYAVNKFNPKFIFNQDAQDGGSGSKWTISAFADWMRGQGHDFDALWRQVARIVVKTVIAAQPMLQYQYDCATKADDDGLMCFELLGFDVLIDENLKPWLLEVNHSPSLTTDTPLDLEIKSRLVREVLALAGVQPGRIRAELAARERAKATRLYTGHAPCVAHAAAGASTGPGGGGSSPSKVGPIAASAASAATPTTPAVPAGSGLPAEGAGTGAGNTRSGATSPGPRSGAISPGPRSSNINAGAKNGPPSPGCTLLGPASEPARGSPEWEAAQRAYEDAHLGQFDRIMPPDNDPELAALYDQLLGGALQVFCRTTTQGRYQHKIQQIKEKRQQEEAEALARQEALQRRAEGLRAWMAAVCQKHREERQMRVAAAAAEAAAAAAAAGTAEAADLDQLATDADGLVVLQDAGIGTGSSEGGSSGCGSGADSRAPSSQAGPGAADWAAASEAAKILQTHFQVARLGLPSSHGQPASVGGGQLLRAVRQCGKAPRGSSGAGSPSKGPAVQACSRGTQPGPACNLLVVSGLTVGAAGQQQCADSARTSSTGRLGSICGSGAGGSPQPRRQLYEPPARSSRGDSVTLEDVIEKRLAAAVEAEAADAADALVAPGLEERALLPPRPGSAALAAWAAAVSRQQSCAAEFAVHGAPGAAAVQNCSAGAARQQPPQQPAQQPPQQPAQRQLVRLHVQPLAWQLTPQPWQQQAWDSCGRLQRGGGALGAQPSAAQLPIGSSSRFLDRVATFTQQQQQLSSEEALADLDLQGSSSSEQVAGEGSSSSGSHGSLTGSGSDQDFAARSADGSVLLPAIGSGKKRAGQETPDSLGSASSVRALDTTYIPPTLLSALHTVRMSPRLLSGLRQGPQGAAPPAPPAAAAGQPAQQQSGKAPWRGGGASRRQSQGAQPGASSKQGNVTPGSSTAAASSSGGQNGGLGQATLNVPWMMPGPELPAAAAGSPAGAQLASGKSSPASATVGSAGKAAGGAAVPRPPGPALPRGSVSSPKALKPAAALVAGTAGAAAPAAGGSPRVSCTGSVGGQAPRGSQHYRASIEQQAVQSVAALINDMINTRGL